MKRMFRPFKEGFIGFFRHFSVSLSSVAVVTFTIVFLGMILIVNDNIKQITHGIEQQIEIWVPVKKENTMDLQSIEQSLRDIKNVANVTLITKEQELEEYIDQYGKSYEFLRSDNPLSDSFVIQAADGQSLAEIAAQIKTMSWQNGVYDGGESTSNLLSFLNGLRLGGTILVISLMALAVFLISNTIKLSIFSRSDEIEIMRIVGATHSFIRTPFLIEGLIIGLFGSIIPIVALYFGYDYLLKNFSTSGAMKLITLSPMNPLFGTVALIIFATALIVGFVGSFISVTKHLRLTR